MIVSTRKEALSLGLPTYYTGRPCRNGHTDLRETKKGDCLPCKQARTTAWIQENPEAMRELKRSWKLANLDKERERQQLSAKRHAERTRAKRGENAKRWRKNNVGKRNAESAARRARKLQAMPPWASKSAIKAIYKEARRLSITTGQQYHVDHIIPLVGQNVCGLHVENNLQILIGAENLAKGNSMPESQFDWVSSGHMP